MEHTPNHIRTSLKQTKLTLIILCLTMCAHVVVVDGLWCVARSDATDTVLQSGLDYACVAGADCTPLQQSGLCFLPNTLQAHASYAYNSFFQHNNGATGSCDFSGSATLAKTDPSYGACVYPSSPSTAGSMPTTTGTTPTTNPSVTTPPYSTAPPYGNSSPFTPSTTSSGSFGGSGINPNMGPPIATTSDSATSRPLAATTLLMETLILLLPYIAVF